MLWIVNICNKEKYSLIIVFCNYFFTSLNKHIFLILIVFGLLINKIMNT